MIPLSPGEVPTESCKCLTRGVGCEGLGASEFFCARKVTDIDCLNNFRTFLD